MKTKDLTLIGLFAALTVVLAWIPAIPVPFSPVPITFQTLGVFLSAAMLGGKRGGTAILVYVLLGALGLPVFAGGAGGFGVILGPTGGYLIGFVLGAYWIGFVLDKTPSPQLKHYALAFGSGLTLIYVIGTIQLSFVLNLPLLTALKVGSLPYIPLDIVKAILAITVATPVRVRLKALGY